jgi:hypothetical protein
MSETLFCTTCGREQGADRICAVCAGRMLPARVFFALFAGLNKTPPNWDRTYG